MISCHFLIFSLQILDNCFFFFNFFRQMRNFIPQQRYLHFVSFNKSNCLIKIEFKLIYFAFQLAITG